MPGSGVESLGTRAAASRSPRSHRSRRVRRRREPDGRSPHGRRFTPAGACSHPGSRCALRPGNEASAPPWSWLRRATDSRLPGIGLARRPAGAWERACDSRDRASVGRSAHRQASLGGAVWLPSARLDVAYLHRVTGASYIGCTQAGRARGHACCCDLWRPPSPPCAKVLLRAPSPPMPLTRPDSQQIAGSASVRGGAVRWRVVRGDLHWWPGAVWAVRARGPLVAMLGRRGRPPTPATARGVTSAHRNLRRRSASLASSCVG